MLEVRHLVRTYKVKNAEPVYALNDVSLKFPETGLVFILGKSGSGKSTLLNVMGGLDEADDGEIIINGKSSKDFTKGELDSYRNTYLGFIFQEYNILSDFTVKENIALALQLQQKKATDEEIDSILEEVDLKGYGKRKPNELSGGQKQRVAIARALVKEPKIIFGDEPTGALDSNTGKQVFETLKKLSKTKLVVVVSHDRDFAEHFGDRVIELKDGKIISDITKKSVESTSEKTGLSLIGDNVVRIAKDRPLTAEDLPLINKAIANAEGDVFITADSHANEAFCEAARIDKNGNRQEFFSTNQDEIQTGEGSFDVVKSKFSLGHAFRMGGKSMKVKPFRLTMTILLSTVSFSLFGLAATLAMFSEKSAIKDAIQTNNINALSVGYEEKTSNGMTEGFTDDVINQIKEETGLQLYTTNNSGLDISIKSKNNDPFHQTYFKGGLEINEEMMKDFDITLDYGCLPTNENEMCISLYSYYSFFDLGINSNDINPELTAGNVTKDDVIGLQFSNHGNGGNEQKTMKITGIVDTKFPENLLKYRNSTEQIGYDDPDYQALSSLSNTIHAVYFYGKSDKENADPDIRVPVEFAASNNYDDSSYYYSPSYFGSHENQCFFDKSKTSLSSNEALISTDNLASILSQIVNSEDTTRYYYTFDGAYIDLDKTDVYTMTNQEYWNVSSSIDQAAKFKTKIDKYQDFYTNDFKLAKQINEAYHYVIYSTDEYGYVVFTDDDYKNATDYQKYELFSWYMDNMLDESSTYHAYYLSVYETYWNDLCETYPKLKRRNELTDLINVLQNAISLSINEYAEEHYEDFYTKYKSNNSYDVIMRRIIGSDSADTPTAEQKKQACCDFLWTYQNTTEYKECEENAIKKKKEAISNMDFSWFDCTLRSSSYDTKVSFPDFKVVGVDIDLSSSALAISKSDATKIRAEAKEAGYYSDAVTEGFIPVANKDISRFLDFYCKKKDALSNYSKAEYGTWKLRINNSEVSKTESYATIFVMLTQTFLYVGIVLAVFSMLLFYNFISVSINNKRREIGILRAVGAKRSDVFKIFYSEAFIMAAINFFLSTIITFVTSYIMNDKFKTSLNLSFTLMNPNVLIILLLLGIALLTSFISSALPVTKIANKKPIDAIQNR